jgi:hypothetical protein
VVSVTFFLGAVRTEAASQTWYYQELSTGEWVNNGEAGTEWVVYETPVLGTYATFYAASNKDTYAPGESVSVSLAASLGDTGPIITNIVDVITNAVGDVFCWFGIGCDSPTPVGVGANFNGSQFVTCDAGGSTSCSGSFTAPTTPGTYTIGLIGCYASGGTCSSSSMSFVVSNPPAPTVQLNFSLLMNKIKSALESIFTVVKTNSLV